MTRDLSDRALGRLSRTVMRTQSPVGLVIDKRYEIVRPIAHGGMGEVYEARDTRLDRPVAMKIVTPQLSGVEWIERFRFEIRTLARIEHPGIVPIHDFGMLPDERLYYTMKLVAGRTVQEMIASGESSESVLPVLIRACDVVQYAHDRGILHRDLKPSNIMADTQGHAYVLDWGIARMTGELQDGCVLGTAEYMAPEQARGEGDGRSDVYALGAVVRCAFRRKIPEDLEAICAKALSSRPEDRYDSPGELARDLERYRRGDPVHARSRSLAYCLRRKLAKRRGLLLLLTLLAASSGVLWRREAELERVRKLRLADLRSTAEVCLDAALRLRRAGDVKGMDEFAERLERSCREVLRHDPRLAEPHYQLGRMYRAQMRFDDARVEQDLALAEDPRFQPARLERGLLDLQRHQERKWIRWAAEKDGESTDLTGEDYPADLEGLEDPLARGLLAWIRKDWAGAKEQFEAASDRMTERYEWLGSVARCEGRHEDAVRWYTRGIEIDRGYFPYWKDRALAYWKLGLHEKALADFSSAVEIAPNEARVRVYRGHLYNAEASRRALLGEGASEFFRKALLDFDEAARLRPDLPYGLAGQGSVRLNQGRFAEMRGEDPREFYLGAIEAYSKALESRVDQDYLLALQGNAWVCLWAHRVFKGDAGESSLERASEACRRSLELNPKSVRARIALGKIRLNLGWIDRSRGKDPTPRYWQALEEFGLATRAEPGSVQAWIAQAGVLCRLGEGVRAIASAEEAIARDPRNADGWATRGKARLVQSRGSEDLRKAAEDFDKAIELAPGDPDHWVSRGSMELHLSDRLVGSAWEEGIARAETYFQRSREIHPENAMLWCWRGRLAMRRALRTARYPDVSLARMTEAEEEFRKARTLQPAISDFWLDGAHVLITRAKLLRIAGRDFQSEVTEGLRLLDRDPADPRGETLRQVGRALLGKALGDPGKSLNASRVWIRRLLGTA